MKIKILLTVLIAILAFSSCSTNRKICSTPSRKEIKKAMSYSSWEYIMPKTQH